MTKLFYFWAGILFTFASYSQSVTITPGTTSPSIEAKSTLNGVKVPMMASYQRTDILNPTSGLLVFDTDVKALYLYNGNNWMRLAVTADDTPSAKELSPNYGPPFSAPFTFGESISYVFPYLIVGDPASNKVTIWKYNNSNGKFDIETVLVPSTNIQAGDNFYGKSVDIWYEGSDKYIAVGHPMKKYNSSLFPNHGVVHIYKQISNVWTLQTSIYPLSTTSDDQFGYSVSLTSGLDGKLTLWAGAPFDDLDSSPNTLDVGATFVFTKNVGGSTWTQKHKFQDAAANSNNKMGACVSASYDEYNSSGAPGNNGNRGAVYTYKYNTGTTNYDLLGKIIPTDVAVGDYFGTSIYVRTDDMIVGSPYADVSGNADQGKVYTFNLQNSISNYNQTNYTDPSGQANDNYGYSVGLGYQYLAIGVPNKTVNNVPKAGGVYSINLATFGSISNMRLLTELNSSYGANFGRALVVSDNSEVMTSSLGGEYNYGQISIINVN